MAGDRFSEFGSPNAEWVMIANLAPFTFHRIPATTLHTSCETTLSFFYDQTGRSRPEAVLI